MTVPRLAVSALAVAAVLLVTIFLLQTREEHRTSVLADAERSFENADRYAEAKHGKQADAESHKLALNTGTDYGDDKVFGADQVFGENDKFGDHNHFGKGTRFAAATRFGDDNTFGSGSVIPSAARFGPGNEFGDEVTIGPMATLGAGVKLGEGSVVGENAAFGPGATVGKGSVLAAGLVFSGGDHFGEGIHFGPNTRFGPNTVFDGDEVFSQGCTFGSHTEFNRGGAGKDSFEGRHYFGEDIEWGAENEPLPPHPPQGEAGEAPPAAYGGAKEGASGGEAGLPPGYRKTSIPGVYEYAAPPAAASAHQEAPRHVQWEWEQPTAVPVAGTAGLAVPDPSRLIAHSPQPNHPRGHVLARLRATARKESHARQKGQAVLAAEAEADHHLHHWLEGHGAVPAQLPLQAGPPLPLPRAPPHHPRPDHPASAPAPSSSSSSKPKPPPMVSPSLFLSPSPCAVCRVGLEGEGRGGGQKGEADKERAARRWSRVRLDGFADKMVRVTGSALHPTAEGRAESVLDDMF